MRKVLPLQKKLPELDAMVTGLRRSQSESRKGAKILQLQETPDGTSVHQDQSAGGVEQRGSLVVHRQPSASVQRAARSADTRALVARPTAAPVPCATAKTNAPAAGRARRRRNAACTHSPRIYRLFSVGAIFNGDRSRIQFAPTNGTKLMDHLDKLENQSIFIIREAFNKIERLAMLWSVGKDSMTLVWLARKAFFGHVPFPCVFMETSFDMPELVELRDRLTKEWKLNLVIARNDEALAQGMNHTRGRVDLLLGAAQGKPQEDRRAREIRRPHRRRPPRRGSDPREGALFLAARQAHGMERRRPAAGTVGPVQHRSRRRHAPPRPSAAALDGDEHLGVRRAREDPAGAACISPKNGKRYRSLGCAPCTFAIDSNADTFAKIREELRTTKKSERSVRAQDQESEDAFEKLRRDGYM